MKGSPYLRALIAAYLHAEKPYEETRLSAMIVRQSKREVLNFRGTLDLVQEIAVRERITWPRTFEVGPIRLQLEPFPQKEAMP